MQRLANESKKARKSRSRGALDSDQLRDLAVTYVARYSTSQAKLHRYLHRKIQQRGWADSRYSTSEACQRVTAYIVERGYIDDVSYAAMRSRSMIRRGLGARRVQAQLRQDGIAAADAEGALTEAEHHAEQSALAFARKRRWGPFAPQAASTDADAETDASTETSAETSDLAARLAQRRQTERKIAAFVRAGHSVDMARQILDRAPE